MVLLWLHSSLLRRCVSFDTSAFRFLAQSHPLFGQRGRNYLKYTNYPPRWPFNATDVSREDESDDALFWKGVERHLDDNAVGGLSAWYEAHLPREGETTILDVCAGRTSHLPPVLRGVKVVGLGLDAQELDENSEIATRVVHDINRDREFPFDEGVFDAIVSAASVEYFARPLETFLELRRIAKPGALVAVTFSDHFEEKKVVKRWKDSKQYQRMLLCASYFHYAGFKGISGERIDPAEGNPLYVVYSRKPDPERRDEL